MNRTILKDPDLIRLKKIINRYRNGVTTNELTNIYGFVFAQMKKLKDINEVDYVERKWIGIN